MIFTGINAQLFIDGEIKVFCLECREVHERHTAENIKKWLKDVMTKFKISEDQLLGISTDSARNITKACNDLIAEIDVHNMDEDLSTQIDEKSQNEPDSCDEEEAAYEESEFSCVESTTVRIPCGVHKLQLPVNDFMWKDKKNLAVLTFFQKLAAKLRNSTVRILIENANLKYAIMDQKTRWNSTYNMSLRLLELKGFCQQQSRNFKALEVPQSKWELLKEITNVLEPIAQLTSELQHEKLDITQFVAYWKIAMFKLEAIRTESAMKLRKLIQIREAEIFSNKIVLAAIFFDKRFSLTLKPEELEVAKTFIKQIIIKKRRLQNPENSQEEEEEEEISVQSQTETDPLNILFEAYLDSFGAPSNPTAPQNMRILDKEFEEFQSLPRERMSVQVKEFWKAQTQFPMLKSAVFDIISAPMTEVSVERLFSHLNFILNKHRSSLQGEILDDILFTRMNKKFSSTCEDSEN